MNKIIRGGLLTVVTLALGVDSGFAGGLYLYEIGSPDVGLAAAGYAARAQDAATVYTNPAGMTRMDRPTLMFGAQPMYLDLKFSPDGNTSSQATTLPGGGNAFDGDSDSWLPAGGMFYVHPVNEEFSLGISITGNFGLSIDYEDDWVGRYYVQETTLQAASIQPAAAWKVNDMFSVGAGVGIVYGKFKDTVAINNIDPNLGDGQLKLKDTDWSVQLNLGLLFEPQPGTRFGLTYLSKSDLNFSDDPDFKDLGPGLEAVLDNRGLLDSTIDLGMTIPQAVMFSVYHELTNRLAILGNLGWQDWSQFGKVDVSIDSDNPNSITTQLDYKDTYHVALGAQYRLSEPLMLTGGVAYDSSMLDDDQRNPSLPVGETWRFGLGTIYDYSDTVTLGAAYTLVWGGDLDMDVERGPLSGRVSGSYDNQAVHVISLNAEFRF